MTFFTELEKKSKIQQSVMAHASNSITWEAKAGWSQVWVQPRLHIEPSQIKSNENTQDIK